MRKTTVKTGGLPEDRPKKSRGGKKVERFVTCEVDSRISS